MYFLLMSVIKERQDKYEGNREEYLKIKQDIDILKELDKIYKEIYDRGYSASLAKKLDRYDIQPGYDMTTNTNLLSRNLAKIEVLEKVLTEDKEELDILTKQLKTVKGLIKKKEWNVKLFGVKV